jgi:ABC-type dipeptide/oligopeptide/nickel transport system ATPase subunit
MHIMGTSGSGKTHLGRGVYPGSAHRKGEAGGCAQHVGQHLVFAQST